MGAVIYAKVPNDIVFYILDFLGDKLVARFSSIDKRLFLLTRDNALWTLRIQRRFSKLLISDEHFKKKGLIDNKFKQYLEYHSEDFFRKHLAEPVTSEMVKSYMNNNNMTEEVSDLLERLFGTGTSMVLIRSIIETPVKLVITIDKCVKGKKQKKQYNITSNTQYKRYPYSEWYKQTCKQIEHLSDDQFLKDIINLLGSGYYIAKANISEKIGNRLLKSSLAELKNGR